MKSKGLIIALLIIISVIIFALVVFLVGVLNGRVDMGFLSFGMRKSDTIIFDKEYKLEDINKIEVLSAAGDVTFEESENDEIRVVAYGKEDNKLDVQLKDNKLKVDYSKANNKWISVNRYSNDVTIYIPSKYVGEIRVKNDYGECKICDLKDSTMELEVNCGNIKVGEVKNLVAKCDLGNVKASNISNKCNIEVNCGDVKIEELQIQENSAIKCDLGSVKIQKINDIYVDANVDLGSTKLGKNNRQSEVTLKVEVDCGDLKVEE